MSVSHFGEQRLPVSQYDLSTYWGRVQHVAGITDPRTLLVNSTGIERAQRTVAAYKQGHVKHMSPELWQAKTIIDSALHPDTGYPIPLPFRMSCFVLSSLPVTALMLSPGIGTVGTIFGQILNQSLNVAINYSNANESSGLTHCKLLQSYLLAVGVSCSMAVGFTSLASRLRSLSPHSKLILGRLAPFAAVASASALNVFLVRAEELRNGIDVFPAVSGTVNTGETSTDSENVEGKSLGKSKKAAKLAVTETALSRVLICAPVMIIPALALIRLQRTQFLRRYIRMVIPVNLGLITVTSYLALPFALAAFPQRQTISEDYLEPDFHGRGGAGGMVAFNRGM
ncbi:Fc.00g000630.m01.CDS01 [Cosmosporella sp. VM-42]